ncbi:phosphoribosyl-dephospho-CoA transferase [[Pantoea] beijingensis]|uniref:Phosphoribosyl-dephospho-CoA transferase n=1 Tax=[Pantoea] beijingensis TaxID=1324864 RepID=A0A443IBW2_9GAMM|nr:MULTISPECIES: malonate decarboxylase holo-ACP synthase [Erwiniaceae]RWR01366.1 phosphoribosyl-dephospho-CoA transferase [[Pantoea] beijingensis]
MLPRPHDLIWLTDSHALQGELPEWVSNQWHLSLPLVVRRDTHPAGLIPVGIRGLRRDQRAAAWATAGAIQRRVTPETLVDLQALLRSPFVSQPPVQSAITLSQHCWSWCWGITGSCGYALATEMPVMQSHSDLDLLIRAPTPLSDEEMTRWQHTVSHLPCRVDTQVDTPFGAFALVEWLRDGRALLKTPHGPRLTSSPWSPC